MLFPREFEVIVVGGSFAGLSAALQLARARRRVLVVDSGLPRNRFAHSSHGFFGQDGQSPSAILALARAQLVESCGTEHQRRQQDVVFGEDDPDDRIDRAGVGLGQAINDGEQIDVRVFSRLTAGIRSEEHEANESRAHCR